MPIKYIRNWELKSFDDIIDVRSPSEYQEDHVPNSINLPVLNNIERKKIGTIYKNKSAFIAKKIGASLVSANIAAHIKKNLLTKPGNWKVLIYCWRGGQRSKSFATVLSEIGWQVYVLKGGYKTYRSSINKKIYTITKKRKFMIIRGPTGCAKTRILQRLKKIGANIIDLEGIAKHKGSLLGSNPNMSQPSQKLFESQIYIELKKIKEKKLIFIESESSKIGNLFLPSILLSKIKTSPAIEINSTINSRVNFLLKDYKNYINKKNSFSELFTHAKSKLGNKIVAKWQQSYKKKEWKDLAFYLITEYYDPLYSHNLKNKNNKVINKYHLKSLTNRSISDFCEVIKKDLGIF